MKALVYAGNYGLGTAFESTLASVATSTLGETPIAVIPGTTHVVAVDAANTSDIVLIDAATMTQIGSALTIAAYISAMVADPSGAYVYVSTYNSGAGNYNITKVQISTWTVVATLSNTSGMALAVSASQGYLLATNEYTPGLLVVSLSSFAVLETINASATYVYGEFAVSADGNSVALRTQGSNSPYTPGLDVISLSSLTVTASITLSSAEIPLAHDGTYFYTASNNVVNQRSSSLALISTATLPIPSTDPIGAAIVDTTAMVMYLATQYGLASIAVPSLSSATASPSAGPANNIAFAPILLASGAVLGNFSTTLTETETAPDSGTVAASFSAVYPAEPIEVLPSGNISATFTAAIDTNAGFAPTNMVPWMLPVAINDHPYVMDFTKSRITTMQVRRQASDNSVEPGEQTLSVAGVWPRAQDNYFLGAGQEFLDNRFAFESVYVHSGEYPSVRTRFWKSQGVNPWVEGKMSLLPEYAGIATSSVNLLIVACGNYLYKTDGATLAWTLNPTLNLTPTWTTVTSANTHNIVSLTTDGSRVWFACGVDGVFVTAAGSTTSVAAATPAALPNIGGLLVYAAGAGTVNATNLPNSATTWSVTKVDAFGNQTAASTATATPASTPMNLNWQPDTNASSYNVYRGSNLVYQGTDPSFVDDGSIAGTPSTVPSTNGTGATAYAATFVLYAKGHLVASTGRDLVEILASGNISFIFQHENPGFVWTCGTECPTAILVGGFAGGTSFVGAIQPDAATNGATLAPPTWATTMTPGEQINAISYDAGAILMGTNLGIRSGTKPDSAGTFDVNPVIEDMGAVQCVASWSQYEYFGWSNYDPSEQWAARSTVSGLGRADLSQYTTPGVPAYATDVMGASAGTTTQCLVILGVPYFVVNNAGVYTLYGPDGLVVPSGWFEPGWIRYGTLENKIVVEVDFQHEPLPAGSSVDYKIVSETMTNVTDVGSNSLAGSTTVDSPFNAGLMVGDRFMPIITLAAASGQLSGPVFHSHITKAMVTTKRQDEVLLALVWSDEAQTLGPAGRTWWLDLYLEYLYLKGLEQLGQTVNLTMGGVVKVAYIDQIMLEPTDVSADRQFFQGTLTVKLIPLS